MKHQIFAAQRQDQTCIKWATQPLLFFTFSKLH